MKLNIVEPNVELVPTTVLTHYKYEASALKSDEEGIAYPLHGIEKMLVPLTLKGESDTMYFPEAVVGISKDMNIVTTPVLGGKGTVKERCNPGDLQVSMTLALVSTSPEGDYDGESAKTYDVYPYKGVERLRKLLDEENRIEVVSDFLASFDLDGGVLGLVVTGYSVEQTTYQNRQEVNVRAVSDYDYDLLIK